MKFQVAKKNTQWALHIILLMIGVLFMLFLLACNSNNDPYDQEYIENIDSIYTVSYNSSDGGYIKGEKNQEIQNGDYAKVVVAIPMEGYIFLRWSDGNNNPYRWDYIKEDLSVTAIFEIKKIKIEYSANDGGYIDGESSQLVSYGQNCKEVMAVALEGYEFIEWSDGEKNCIREDCNVVVNNTLFAYFKQSEYTLTYRASLGGTIKIGNKTDILQIQHVYYGYPSEQVFALAHDNYHFVGWSDGVLSNTRNINAVKDNLDVTAMFEIDSFDLTYRANRGGNIVGEANQTVMFGSNAECVEAIEDDGFSFLYWSDGKKERSRQDLNIQCDMEISAVFAQKGSPLYKILMVFVTDVNAEIMLKDEKKVNINYTMSNGEMQICKMLPEYLEIYLNNISNSFITFDVDYYFTSNPLGSDSIRFAVDHNFKRVYYTSAEYILELSPLLCHYESIITLYCFNDYEFKLINSGGFAYEKYAVVNLEAFFTCGIDYMLEHASADFFKTEIQLCAHEFIHTVEMRVAGDVGIGLHSIFEYYPGGSKELEKYYGLYLLGDLKVDDGYAGIPKWFWADATNGRFFI